MYNWYTMYTCIYVHTYTHNCNFLVQGCCLLCPECSSIWLTSCVIFALALLLCLGKVMVVGSSVQEAVTIRTPRCTMCDCVEWLPKQAVCHVMLDGWTGVELSSRGRACHSECPHHPTLCWASGASWWPASSHAAHQGTDRHPGLLPAFTALPACHQKLALLLPLLLCSVFAHPDITIRLGDWSWSPCYVKHGGGQAVPCGLCSFQQL